MDEIEDLESELTGLEARYLADFADVEDYDKERLEDIWVSVFMPKYRSAADRIEIYLATCRYRFTKCEVEVYKWGKMYDRRGFDYREEFLETVARIVKIEMTGGTLK
jgi:hypothetical protein